MSDKNGDDADSKRNKKLRDISLTLATKTGALLKDLSPGLEGPVSGIEFFVTTYRAASAWGDQERASIIDPSLKTAQAVISALNTIKVCIPKLNDISPHLKTIGLLVSVGDVLYQLYTTTQDDPGKPDGKI